LPSTDDELLFSPHDHEPLHTYDLRLQGRSTLAQIQSIKTSIKVILLLPRLPPGHRQTRTSADCFTWATFGIGKNAYAQYYN